MSAKAFAGLALAAAPLAACNTHPLDATTVGTLTDSLVAHYTFDEGSGTVVVDHSGNRKDGVMVGGQWLPSDGKFGGALRLGGSGYVSVDSFPDARASWSVSAWVRSTKMPLDGLETLLSTEVVFEAGWELNLNKVADAGQTIESAYWDPLVLGYTHYDCPCVPEGAWAHIVSVLDGAAHTLTVYVDGQVVGVTSAPEPVAPGERTLLIGKWSGELRYLVGDIDDVAIYGKALVQQEVLELEQHSPPDPM